MRRVRYAGGTFVTGDREAEALVRYAAALANVDRAAGLRVPGLDARGRLDDYELLVGPASQLLVEPADQVGDLPDPSELLAEIDRRIDELTWRPPAESGLLDLDLDL
jgi:hypothetical protein